MKYKAILFDIDGTLYPNKLMYRLSLPTIIRHPKMAKMYSRVRTKYRETQEKFDEIGLKDADFTTREAAMLCLCDSSYKLVEAENALSRRFYKGLEKGYRRLKVQPDTVEVFKLIKSKGLEIGIFSDWPFYSKLEQLQIKEYVKVAINSYDCGYLKPDKRCFEPLLEKMGMKPNEVLYVGDSYSKDVLGANNAGIDAVLVNVKKNRKSKEKDKEKYPKAVAVFDSIKSFGKWIEKNMEEDV